VRRH